MKYTCPHCGTAKELDQSAIPPQGIELQCFNCFNDFHVPYGMNERATSNSEPNRFSELQQQAQEPSYSNQSIFDQRVGFGLDLDLSPTDSKLNSSVAKTPSSQDLIIKRSTSNSQSSSNIDDLPRLVTSKKAALKTFNTPSPLNQQSVLTPPPPPVLTPPPPPVLTPPPPPVLTPPPPPVLTPPPPQESPELFAVQSAPQESPELFAVQSAPQESPELFAIQSAPQESPELFAIQSAPQESPELFAVQSAPQKSPELFAVQSAPQESPELFAVQSAPQKSPELFAVQSAPQESPELFAIQSAPQESPELFAVQSAPQESPELFAVQSAPQKSSELQATGTVGQIEFGGLSDLFDQADEEVETMFDASPQGKSAILEAQAQSQVSSVQESIFSNENMSFDGGFDFGVSRDFQFEDSTYDSANNDFATADLINPDSTNTEVEQHFAYENQVASGESAPIVFEMSDDSEQQGVIEEAVNDELMSITTEDEAEEAQQDLGNEPEPSASQEVQQHESEKEKQSANRSLLWIALVLIALGGYLFIQQPELVQSISEQFTQLGSDDQAAQSSQRNQANGQQRALGESAETSSQLRNISRAAKGQITQNQTALESNRQQQATNQQATNQQATKASTQKTAKPEIQNTNEIPSWFKLNQSVKSAFKESDLEKVGAYAETLKNPSPLDAEGFHTLIQKMKASKEVPTSQKIEALAMGALHFNRPETIWAQDAYKLSEELEPEIAQSPEGERALTATHLIHQVDGARERAIALGLARPQDPSAQELMGHAYLQRKQNKKAQEAFDRARKLDPKRSSAHQKFAELALKNGDLDQAKKTLKRLVKEGHGSPELQRALAEVNLREGNHGRAFGWINNLFEAPKERLNDEDQAKAMGMFAQIMQSEMTSTKALKKKTTENEDMILRDQEQAKFAALRSALTKSPDQSHLLDQILESSIKSRNWKLALQEVESLNKKSGGSVSLALKEFELLKKLERNDKAAEKLKQTISQYPQDPRPSLVFGKELLKAHDYAKARSVLEKAHQINPENPQPILALTDLLIKEARVKEAQAYLKHQIDEQPWSSVLHNGFGDIKLKIAQTSGQEKFFQEAKKAYDQALDIDPSNHQARAQRARASLALNEPKEALKDLQWLKQQGYHGDLNFEFGQAQQSLGEMKEAQRYYEAVLEQHREHLNALRSMGMVMESSKKYPKAKQYYEQALAVNPRDPETRFAMGKLLFDQKDYSKAVENLRVASEIKQQDPKLHYWYGRALENSGDSVDSNTIRNAYESAALLIKQSAETSPELCDIHYRVGHIHSQQSKELSLALDDFTRASRCAPQRAEVWSSLAGLYHKVGDTNAVMKHYERALKNNPRHVPALIGTAREYLNQTPPKVSQAKKALDTILKQNKKHPEALYRYCTLLQPTSRRKAKKYCQSYLKVQPKGEFAESAKEIIRSL